MLRALSWIIVPALVIGLSMPANAAKATKPAKAAAAETEKVVGKTATGETVYEGPRGGLYTKTGKGNKESVKKEDIVTGRAAAAKKSAKAKSEKAVTANVGKASTKKTVPKAEKAAAAKVEKATAKASLPKAEKAATAAAKTPAATLPAPRKKATAAEKASATEAATTDPVMGTYNGRDVHLGPKGGHYTLTAAGNKEYLNPEEVKNIKTK